MQDRVTAKGTATKRKLADAKSSHETKRCCHLERYDDNIFKSCERHLANECRGFKISGHETNCHSLNTTFYVGAYKFKGLCIPSRTNCTTNSDCLLLKLGNEFISPNCNDQNICEYTN